MCAPARYDNRVLWKILSFLSDKLAARKFKLAPLAAPFYLRVGAKRFLRTHPEGYGQRHLPPSTATPCPGSSSSHSPATPTMRPPSPPGGYKEITLDFSVAITSLHSPSKRAPLPRPLAQGVSSSASIATLVTRTPLACPLCICTWGAVHHEASNSFETHFPNCARR